MATSLGQTPQVEIVKRRVAAVAAGSDATVPLCRVPFTGTVTAIKYVPAADVTGDDTETRTLTVVNKGADGSGTTEVATLALETDTDLADFDENALTLTDPDDDADALDVTEGDILSWASVHGGDTGLADPGGIVLVTFNRA